MSTSDSYKRLLTILTPLAKTDVEAALARWLTEQGFSANQQILNNWKRRGVSKQGAQAIGKLIGFNPNIVLFPQDPGADRAGHSYSVQQDVRTYSTASANEEALLLQAFRISQPEARAPIVAWAQSVLAAQGLTKRTGT